MKLSELINLRELEELIEDGYVSDRKHPRLPLAVLNYTPKAVEIKQWSDTLSYCRGLVYDRETTDVVAIPFKKFWNYGDEGHTGPLPSGKPRIFEKADGSFLNLFFYKGEAVVCTRGSFESDQAKWAQKWVDEHLVGMGPDWFSERFNYIFEVIIKEDKKVVDYDFEGLVFLGYVRLEDGTDYGPDNQVRWLKGYRVAKELEYEDLEKLQARNLDNEEGYVCSWYNSIGPAFRVKLKFETYKLLHRMYFQTTAEVIWELTKAGEFKEKTVDEYLSGADEKLKVWARKIVFSIALNRTDIEIQSKKDFRECIGLTNILWDLEAPEKERRKAFAMYATKRNNPSLLFTLYDGKMVQYEEQLWKLAKPENSRFRDQGEEE